MPMSAPKWRTTVASAPWKRPAPAASARVRRTASTSGDVSMAASMSAVDSSMRPAAAARQRAPDVAASGTHQQAHREDDPAEEGKIEDRAGAGVEERSPRVEERRAKEGERPEV